MCLAVPARVTALDEQDHAKVEMLGNVMSANLVLVEDVSVGDYVLLHAGFAIEKLSAEDAKETLALFRTMEGIVDDDPGC